MSLTKLSLSRLSNYVSRRIPGRADGGSPEPRPEQRLSDAIAYLNQNVPWFGPSYQHAANAFNFWGPMGVLPPECYVGKDILDIGCGNAASSTLFLERGAKSVWGIDPVTLSDQHLEWLAVLPDARFHRDRLRAEVFGSRTPRFDLAFSHWVTEHVSDIPEHFALIYDLLRPGGRYVSLHDNYYAPMGGHDHGYMGPDAENPKVIKSQAVRCWELPEKCESSAAFREGVAQRHDPNIRTWKLTPDDCTRCPHYHRAQVWGHLLFSDDWAATWGNVYGYRTGLGLNKVSSFQLKQFLIEAGFEVASWHLNKVENVPPPELAARFPIDDLLAMGVLWAAVKR